MLGSGALRSSASDLVRFIEANLGLRESALHAAMRATHATEADRQLPDLDMGLGWFHSTLGGRRITWHNGGTVGFRSHVGMDLAARRGVVVLANSDSDVTNLGYHLLEPSIPLHLPSPPREFRAVKIASRLLDEYAGTYKASANDRHFVRFHHDGDQLFASTAVETVRVFAESRDTFFTEDQDSWGTFTRDSRGRVDGITWLRENYRLQLQRMKATAKP